MLCRHSSVDIMDNETSAKGLEKNVNVCQVKSSQGWHVIDSDTLAVKRMISLAVTRWALA